MPPDASAPAAENLLVARFDRLPLNAVPIAGGKGASLSRMAQAGLPVPPGFVICAAGFRDFLSRHDGLDRILSLTAGLDVHDDAALNHVSGTLRHLIVSNALPAEIDEAIRDAYLEMSMDRGEHALVAVRSSAVSEDGDAASFAGQQDTFLNVRGAAAVGRHVRECWASFFAPRALFYRAQKGVLADANMAVVVQEMVQAEKSGVMFTVDPVHKRRDHMMIEAIFGLGEAIVSGLVTPDHYVVDRTGGGLVREFIAVQPSAIMYDSNTAANVQVALAEHVGSARVLSDGELHRLRELGLRLEDFFGKPQDVEWCIRGPELLLLQSRPITTLS